MIIINHEIQKDLYSIIQPTNIKYQKYLIKQSDK